MRRNRNSGRGGSRGSLNMPGGPLLTAHLKDIDLELELLKRKREMIEQQQYNMQPYKSQQPARNYNQPTYYAQNSHGDPNSDFSHLYNDGPQQYRKPFGKKRQSDSEWPNEPFPKRSSGQGVRGQGYGGSPPVRNQRPYSSPVQPKGFKYGQGKQFIGQKIANQKQQKPIKTNLNNKIVKPTKAQAPPNKLAAQPVAERNDLVAAAIKSVAEVESREREALRLLPDQVPTKQVTGRLELALGSVLRDIREKCAETKHEEMLRAAALQRVMKQAIRDRIKTAMLGKIVGSTTEIIKEYRAIYPKETDIEIVNKALEVANVAPVKPRNVNTIVPDKNKPDEFYRENMCLLLEMHLKEMFDKIEEIYNPPEENQKEGEVVLREDVEASNADKSQDNMETSKQEKENEAGEAASTNPEEGKTTDGGEGSNDANVGEASNNAGAGEADKSVNEESLNASASANPTDAAKVKAEDIVAKLKNASPYDYKRMLPRILKKHIPMIIKMLQINKMYRNAVADLTTATRAKYVEYGKSPIVNGGSSKPTSESVSISEVQTPSKFAPPLALPYYVKVMGKPQLPKKKVMQAFLDIFHPKSIKKHRSIHNLLFIGFAEKSDFDAIVQADGTTIGRTTLSIRICDKNTSKPDDTDASTITDTADQSLDSSDIIGSDLDGQISDLLSSIRSAEDEKPTGNTAEQNKSDENQCEEATGNGETMSTDNVVENIDLTDKEDAVDAQKAEENSPVKEQVTSAKGEVTPVKEQVTSAKGEVTPVKEQVTSAAEENEDQPVKAEANDQVAELKNATTGRATPTRASTRLASTPATPSSIRTRRASRLGQ